MKSRILVVDDSLADRKLISGLLSRNEQWEITEASDGLEALEYIEAIPPDIVVADLIMPRMNGRELAEAIRRRKLNVPVVLVTGKGSEQVAAGAVRHGAVAYVPKKMLAEQLERTVEQVLNRQRERQRDTKLLHCLQRFQAKFVLENDPDSVATLCVCLEHTLESFQFMNASERHQFLVGLQEALWNALYHGNLEIGEKLYELDPQEFIRLVQERRQQPPYSQRRIFVYVDFSPTEARCVVSDEGRGFDPSSLPDVTAPENLFRPGGRGILLMRTCIDQVVYNSKGNEVTLIKRLRRHAA